MVKVPAAAVLFAEQSGTEAGSGSAAGGLYEGASDPELGAPSPAPQELEAGGSLAGGAVTLGMPFPQPSAPPPPVEKGGASAGLPSDPSKPPRPLSLPPPPPLPLPISAPYPPQLLLVPDAVLVAAGGASADADAEYVTVALSAPIEYVSEGGAPDKVTVDAAEAFGACRPEAAEAEDITLGTEGATGGVSAPMSFRRLA